MFEVGKLIGSLLMPPGILLLLVAAGGLSVFLGRRRLGLALLVATLVLGWGLSSATVADLLIHPLETGYAPFSKAPGATGIVALGGGMAGASPEYGGLSILSPESLQRCLYAGELALRLDLPLIYSSGNPLSPGTQEADAQAAVRLWRSMGVPARSIRVEAGSRDTWENAQFTKALAGSGPFIVVTSAWHMPRAMLAFARAGATAVAAPTAYRSKSRPFVAYDLLPNPESMLVSAFAVHEYVGLAWYRLTKH